LGHALIVLIIDLLRDWGARSALAETGWLIVLKALILPEVSSICELPNSRHDWKPDANLFLCRNGPHPLLGLERCMGQ
jgi:hypothetical protein